jgi:hypothetical protein
MAKYLQGINGIFIGKVGSVVGCVLNGTPYMRSKPRPRTGRVGATEQQNRDKFAAMQAWLKPFLPLLRAGFKSPDSEFGGYNAAKSYNLKNAMVDGVILLDHIRISMGDLLVSNDLQVRDSGNKSLIFEWDPAYIEGTDPKDQIMVLAYHPESRTAIYALHGAFRDSGVQDLKIPSDLIGKTIQVYAAFIAADRSRQSDSVYLAALAVEVLG